MPEPQEFVVNSKEAGQRLDILLARRMPDWTRSQLQRLIRAGQVSVNGAPAGKAGLVVEPGQRVAVVAEREPLRAVPEALPLEVLYEDNDLLVVNKPAGMVVHVGAGVKSGTMVNALLHHLGGAGLSTAGGELRPGIVHRLDRMTSGIVLVAKNDFTHRALAAQFKAREVKKVYRALVHGRVKAERGEISRPVGRDPRRRVRMKAGGIAPREALTEYQVLKRWPGFTYLEARPRTGRTHQIRVHLAGLGHPVVGDSLYGAPAEVKLGGREMPTLGRTFLHAAAIEFRHPRSGATMRFEAPLATELQAFLASLDGGE